MKKLCCVGLSLLLAGDTVASLLAGAEDKVLSPEEIASRKADLKDPAKLKAFLTEAFSNDWSGSFISNFARGLKEMYDVPDDILKPVLLDIYRESAQKTGWKNGSDRDARWGLFGAIWGLADLADKPVREMLLGIAKDSAKDVLYRYPAILGYVRCAEAQDVRDLFVWLLGDKKRFPVDLRGSLVKHIRDLWDAIEADEQKREALLASLYVAVALEKDAWVFGGLDDFLAQRSEEYRTSRQRVDLLKKNGKASDASGILDSRRKAGLPLTSVSTSLKELMKRDFGKPPEGKAP